MENPTLKNPEVLQTFTTEQTEALRALVSSNLHPVSRSLFDALGPSQGSAEARGFSSVEEVMGQGLRMKDSQNRAWILGRSSWVQDETDSEQGDSVFSCHGKVLARFDFEDALRPETSHACQVLKNAGCTLYLLSGDREEKVRKIAEALGIPSAACRARLTPEEKKCNVEALDANDTLYLGDGANDSLALEAALCCGSPVTGRNFLEHRADFYFLGNSLRFVPKLLEVARKRERAVTAVFAFASLYNAAAVALSLLGLMSPLLAAVLMPLSSVVTLGIVRGVFGSGIGLAVTPSATQQDRAISPQTVRGFAPMGSV
jgi:Cu2+-exporting ATPase